MEYNASGSAIGNYWHGVGIDEPIRMIKNSNTYYYTFDGLGSVTDLTDNSETVQE